LGISASSAVTIICEEGRTGRVRRTKGVMNKPARAGRALTCSRLMTMVRSRDSSAVEKLRRRQGV
jgi:hypothetical protein